MNDKNYLVINIPLLTSEIDVILNALQEKQLAIGDLYQSIYSKTEEQINFRKKFIEGKEIENMESKKIICKDCGKEFEYTVGEQKFYEEKGFPAPIRCKECRDAKKARNEKRETQSNNDIEEMLKKFQKNTIKF